MEDVSCIRGAAYAEQYYDPSCVDQVVKVDNFLLYQVVNIDNILLYLVVTIDDILLIYLVVKIDTIPSQ